MATRWQQRASLPQLQLRQLSQLEVSVILTISFAHGRNSLVSRLDVDVDVVFVTSLVCRTKIPYSVEFCSLELSTTESSSLIIEEVHGRLSLTLDYAL